MYMWPIRRPDLVALVSRWRQVGAEQRIQQEAGGDDRHHPRGPPACLHDEQDQRDAKAMSVVLGSSVAVGEVVAAGDQGRRRPTTPTPPASPPHDAVAVAPGQREGRKHSTGSSPLQRPAASASARSGRPRTGGTPRWRRQQRDETPSSPFSLWRGPPPLDELLGLASASSLPRVGCAAGARVLRSRRPLSRAAHEQRPPPALRRRVLALAPAGGPVAAELLVDLDAVLRKVLQGARVERHRRGRTPSGFHLELAASLCTATMSSRLSKIV